MASNDEIWRVVQDVAEAGWNTGDFTALDKVITEDCLHYGVEGPPTDNAVYKSFIEAVRTGLPDFHLNVCDPVVDGDQIAFRLEASGTHTAELTHSLLGTYPPTGRVARLSGVALLTVRDGKMAVHRFNADWPGFLEQLS
jgi:predicted ester cyclase